MLKTKLLWAVPLALLVAGSGYMFVIAPKAMLILLGMLVGMCCISLGLGILFGKMIALGEKRSTSHLTDDQKEQIQIDNTFFAMVENIKPEIPADDK